MNERGYLTLLRDILEAPPGICVRIGRSRDGSDDDVTFDKHRVLKEIDRRLAQAAGTEQSLVAYPGVPGV